MGDPTEPDQIRPPEVSQEPHSKRPPRRPGCSARRWPHGATTTSRSSQNATSDARTVLRRP